MAVLAAICGVLIALFGLLATGRAPSDAQMSMEVTAFVGGLVLCFLAVVLARLKNLERRLAPDHAPGTPQPDEPAPEAEWDPPEQAQPLMNESNASL